MSFDLGILDSVVKSKKFVPNNIDSIYYLFFDKGIGFTELSGFPIPYIITILNTHSYVKAEEERAYKKANRK